MRNVNVCPTGVNLVGKLKFINGILFDHQKRVSDIKEPLYVAFVIYTDRPGESGFAF